MKKKGLYLLGILSLLLVLGIGISGCAPSSDTTDLQGERGLQGIPGIQGPQGLHGLQGEKGAKGDTGKRGYEGEQGERGYTGTKGDIGLQGEQGIPSSNLIVAMGYIYEQTPGQPDGNPRLVRGYNVEDVIWDSNLPGYVITLTNIDYHQPNYVVQITPMISGLCYAGCSSTGDGKLSVQLFYDTEVTTNGFSVYRATESFQFVVFRYPD